MSDSHRITLKEINRSASIKRFKLWWKKKQQRNSAPKRKQKKSTLHQTEHQTSRNDINPFAIATASATVDCPATEKLLVIDTECAITMSLLKSPRFCTLLIKLLQWNVLTTYFNHKFLQGIAISFIRSWFVCCVNGNKSKYIWMVTNE